MERGIEWAFRAPTQKTWPIVLAAGVTPLALILASIYFFGEMGIAVSVIASMVLVHLIDIAFDGSSGRRLNTEQGNQRARIGADGLLLEEEFIPWSAVLAIENEAEGVAIIRHVGAKRVYLFDEGMGFAEAAHAALEKYRTAPEPPRADALERRSESAAEREARLATLKVASGYRDVSADSVDPQALAEIACHPRSNATTRLEAAKILARVEPARLIQVRVVVEQTAEPELARVLADTLGERLDRDR